MGGREGGGAERARGMEGEKENGWEGERVGMEGRGGDGRGGVRRGGVAGREAGVEEGSARSEGAYRCSFLFLLHFLPVLQFVCCR